MHSAPWTKASTSASQPRQISPISRPDSSRASTTRWMPREAATRAPPRVWRLIWVLAWSVTSGATSRARCHTPQSWISTASTPISLALRSASAAWGSSRSDTRVFSVRYTFTPRRWQ